MSKIIIVHGDKGGVGKSTVAAALGDWILRKGRKLELIDCDLRNADVARLFDGKENATTHLYNLTDQKGWIELANLLNKTEADHVLLSLPAGVGEHFKKFGKMLEKAITRLDQQATMLFVLDRAKDSIILLNEAMNDLGYVQNKFAVRNLNFGTADMFVLWNDSKSKTKFEEAGGTIIDFPYLHDGVAYHLRNHDILFSDAITDGPKADQIEFGEQMVLETWLAEIDELFDTHCPSS